MIHRVGDWPNQRPQLHGRLVNIHLKVILREVAGESGEGRGRGGGGKGRGGEGRGGGVSISAFNTIGISRLLFEKGEKEREIFPPKPPHREELLH